MPFSFIDVEAQKSRNIIFLFITLVLFYFIGAFLIYLALFVEGFLRTSKFHLLYIFDPRKILIIFAVSFGIALMHWLFSTINMIPRILNALRARFLDPDDRYHQMYKNIVDEVSIAARGRHIEPYVINSHYLNAFAVTDFKDRSVIGITEGLLVKLSRRQLEAVVAHEASHIVWNDSLLTTIGCSITSVFEMLYRMMTSTKHRSGGSSRGKGGVGSLLILLIIIIMRFLTLLLNMWISRERETRADATAVRMTRDPLSLAEALYSMTRGWRGAQTSAQEYTQIFIINPAYNKLEEKSGFFADLFSTHPPMKERLGNLLNMAHADISSLESSVKKKVFSNEDIIISTPDEQPVWFVNNNGVWEGPFILSHMSQFSWFKPDSWVKKQGSDAVKPAYEYNEINLLFKKNYKADAGSMDCPACRQPLEQIYYEGVMINKCLYCQGMLISYEKLPRIIAREERAFSDEIKKMAQIILQSPPIQGYKPRDVPSQLVCPKCSVHMIKKPYQPLYPRFLEIDECFKCGLIWFDKNELEVVQYIHEQLAI